MVTGQGTTSSLTDLVDEAVCIVCLHGPEDKASVNEDMPSAVRRILETTTRLIREMGEHVQYPSRMHWLDCCHQPIHVTCMIRPFYRMEEWKCPHCRRTLASALWGPIENVKIDTSLWPASFQDVDAFVQSRLTLTDHDFFHLMQAWDVLNLIGCQVSYKSSERALRHSVVSTCWKVCQLHANGRNL